MVPMDKPGLRAVGLRTGPEDGRIISIDLDGESAVDRVCDFGLNPFAGTFIVGRRGDTYRLAPAPGHPEQAAEAGVVPRLTVAVAAGSGAMAAIWGEGLLEFSLPRTCCVVP